jgi:rubrerythrin
MGGYGGDYDYSTDDQVVKKSAKSYNVDHKRDYKVHKVETRAKLPPPIDKVLLTKANFPIVVAVDVTGSMKTWPQLIFEKLCILYNETLFFLPEQLKEHFEISFTAIGDAYTDGYPLQITDFGQGFELDKNIKNLYPEGGGGGQARETYELTAYFYATHCEMPEALKKPKPMFIFIGDEGYYSKVNRGHIKKLIGDQNIKTDLISQEVFEELKKKFNVYILRVEYGNKDDEIEIHKSWEKVLGPEHVIMLKDPRRVVDTILGLIAATVDGFESFQERIEIRQTPEQVKQVYSTLHGLKTEEKSYVYEFQVLTCPNCGANLEEAPEHDKPKNCPFCGVILVRI